MPHEETSASSETNEQWRIELIVRLEWYWKRLLYYRIDYGQSASVIIIIRCPIVEHPHRYSYTSHLKWLIARPHALAWVGFSLQMQIYIKLKNILRKWVWKRITVVNRLKCSNRYEHLVRALIEWMSVLKCRYWRSLIWAWSFAPFLLVFCRGISIS